MLTAKQIAEAEAKREILRLAFSMDSWHSREELFVRNRANYTRRSDLPIKRDWEEAPEPMAGECKGRKFRDD